MCFKLQINSTSAEGKKNQLMLLLDYNEDRSIYAPKKFYPNFLVGYKEAKKRNSKVKKLNMDDAADIQRKEAKVHIDTLSSFKGFGGGAYKMTAVKKMTSTDAFLNMAPEVKKCEVESYEQCRTRRLSEECSCVHSTIATDQVRSLVN